MFEDREDAGNKLASKLKKVITNGFVVVALLRGGIVLGKKVSDHFKIPLMPLSVKKIGAPFNSELAIGAVTFDKTSYFDQDLIKHLNVNEEYIKNAQNIKWKEARGLQKQLKNKISLKNKKVLIVDDGIATGATAICAEIYVKKQKAEEIILATPVIAKDSLRNIKKYFDRVVSLKIPSALTSVSQFYRYFPQVSDEEVIEILNRK
ncbi:MAG: phosphoribosyltransferase [Candidatus Levybacteria bacterium]|nr:phosphoribosyltransferase [Candidatus Levybacteria bacterium]